MKIRCIEGMYRLKLVSGEKKSGFKGIAISLMVHVRTEIWGE